MQALKLGVPLYLKDKVEWDTSFGRVGQHRIRCRIVNVRGKKDDKSVFIYLVNSF